MPHSLRSFLLLGTLLIAQAAQAYLDEDDEDEDDRPGRTRIETVDTPKARYQARMDMLNARIEMRRKYCKATSRGSMDYCSKEVEQAEREGRYKIEQAYKDELAKEGAEE